jgi:hypothetical protein
MEAFKHKSIKTSTVYRIDRHAHPRRLAWKQQIDALLADSVRMLRKHRYTAPKIYIVIQAAGFGGGESTVRAFDPLRVINSPICDRYRQQRFNAA